MSQCRWPPSPDKPLTETMRNFLPRGQPPGRASPARVEIAPQFWGENVHRLLGEYLSPATPWCRAAFLLRNALKSGDTMVSGGRHHGVVPTLLSTAVIPHGQFRVGIAALSAPSNGPRGRLIPHALHPRLIQNYPSQTTPI